MPRPTKSKSEPKKPERRGDEDEELEVIVVKDDYPVEDHEPQEADQYFQANGEVPPIPDVPVVEEADPKGDVILMQELVERQEAIITALREEQEAYVQDSADMNQERENLLRTVAELQQMQVGGDVQGRQKRFPVKTGYRCPRYNGETEWNAFLVQFEAWLRLGEYDETETNVCGDLLGLAMEGDAQMMYSSMSHEERSDYRVLKKKLQERYGGETTAEVFKAKLLGGKKRQHGESISKFRDEMWLMTKKAYPQLPRIAQDQIALDAFLRAVDTELRIHCTMQKCKTLGEAVAVIESFEAVAPFDADRRRRVVRMVGGGEEDQGEKEEDDADTVKVMHTTAERLTTMVEQQSKLLQSLQNEKMKFNRAGQDQAQYKAAKDECFNCRQKGHFARDCPETVDQ